MQHRADDNQERIVDDLREIGASVTILSQVGFGVPDLLVGFRGETYLFEVKEPGERLRETQQNWFNRWRGGPAKVIHNSDEAMRLIGAL